MYQLKKEKLKMLQEYKEPYQQSRRFLNKILKISHSCHIWVDQMVKGIYNYLQYRVEKDSLKIVIPKLEELLGTKVNFVNDCVGGEA